LRLNPFSPCTGIINNEIQAVLNSKLFPNPNNGIFKIELKNQDKSDKITIFIYDITGKEVFRNENQKNSSGKLEVESGLSNGAYLLKVLLNDGSSDIHRLIIEK